MSEADELSHLIEQLRGVNLAIGVDDVARIAAVLHHTRSWARERRVRALKTLLGRSPLERERFDHIAPLLLAPRVREPPSPADVPQTALPDASSMAATPVDPGPRWPLVAGAAVIVAAVALTLHDVWPDPTPTPSIGAPVGSAEVPPDDRVIPTGPDVRQITVSEPSSLPETLRGVTKGFGVASLVLAAWSLLALRPSRRRRAAIERLMQSPGRRMMQLEVDRASLQPIDRTTIASLAHMLAAPAFFDRQTTLDPYATVEHTARNAGRLTLCFEREREQPPLILLEDVSRSMERWPAHAAQLARALEAQGQPVERKFIASDPLQISDRRSLDGRTMQLEDARASARIVIVSDGAYFDRDAARTIRHVHALPGTIWLQPRPGELWRSGARWINDHALARTLGVVPGSLELPADPDPAWRPPRARADIDETADAWRSALTDEVYFAFASTALLDLAMSWRATFVWALISDDVIAPPWRSFERIWDLPEMTLLPGGRIRLAPELRDRLLADARGERPELLRRVAGWIDARLAAVIAAAGENGLGATVGQVYRDRVARAAGLDASGARIRLLARQGLASVVSAHVGDDERQSWRVRDPNTAMTARLRGPLLALALLGTAGFGAASVVAPARHDVSRTVSIDAGTIDTADAEIDGAIDAPVSDTRIDAAIDAAIDVPLDVPRDTNEPDRRPTVKAVEPDHAVAGASVRIRGAGFATIKQPVEVRFGKAKLVNARISSDTEIVAQTPRDLAPGPTEVAVTFGKGQRRFLLKFVVDPAKPLPADSGVDGGVDPGSPDAGLKDESTISGSVVIDRNVTMSAKHVTIADGSRIRVRNGATLRIEGIDITLQGSAEIDGTGDEGARGQDGTVEPDAILRDRASFDPAKKRCLERPPNGSRGGDGGPGATIVLRGAINNEDGLAVRVDGGKGGPGGRGVPGRLLTLLQQRPKPYEEEFSCPAGADGPPGNAGPRGSVSRSSLKGSPAKK